MRTRSLGRGLSCLICIAAFSAIYAQAGKAVTNHDASCQVTVPDSWEAMGSFGIANAPDKSMDVAVTSPHSDPSLASLKQTAQMIYSGDKVVKDTATEFQMEGQGLNGRPNVYRGIQIPGKVCIVEVTYSNGATDDARKIALSLKPAK